MQDILLHHHGRREFGVVTDGVPRLDLAFDDVESPDPDDVLSLQRCHARRRWAEQNGLREVAPTREDARAIVEFAHSLGDSRDGVLLCHCGAGISRAPAAALICLAVWRGVGEERRCVDEVLAIRPAAQPHRGLIRFADELLDRDGRLIGAITNGGGM